ncbi:MAG: hypothetical protein IH801_04310 [Nitrospinae bacterium]|nr:hypothetical protein [Nitrospinota bacterium]
MHVHESRAYVSDGPTLRIFDVADPAKPTLLGSYTLPMNIYAVRVSGSFAYAAVDFYGLGIVVTKHRGGPIEVIAPIEGTPAARASRERPLCS